MAMAMQQQQRPSPTMQMPQPLPKPQPYASYFSAFPSPPLRSGPVSSVSPVWACASPPSSSYASKPVPSSARDRWRTSPTAGLQPHHPSPSMTAAKQRLCAALEAC